jgi:polyisoprenyl-phosphate glycosyltransferase
MEINKEKKLISAVIYLHNSQDEILEFLKKIINLISNSFDKFEIIIVNDCSLDNSIDLIKKNEELKSQNISVINMSVYQGLEISMCSGIDLSIGDFVYEFDDLNIDYNENLIFESFIKITKGYDIVSVSPNKSNSIFSNIYYKIFNNFSKSKYKIRSERFRILSRRAINRAYSINKTIPFRKALYANSGLKMDVITYRPSQKLIRKLTKETSLFRNKMAINSFIIYTNLAFKISLLITIILFCFTMLSSFYTFYIFFSEKKPIEGWTTIMLLISGSFSGIFFVLAIIIKYLSLLIEMIYTQKTYLVESIEKI